MKNDDGHGENPEKAPGERPAGDDEFLADAVLIEDEEPPGPESPAAEEAEEVPALDARPPDGASAAEPAGETGASSGPEETAAEDDRENSEEGRPEAESGRGGPEEEPEAAEESREDSEEARETPEEVREDSEEVWETPEESREDSEEDQPDGGFIPASEEAPPVKVFRPAVRSLWFLFLGLGLGPAVIYFERDPDQGPARWIVLGLICLGLIIHRLSLSYALSPRYLTAASWWGLGRDESVTLARISEVRPRQGFVGRLAGCAHLEVSSSDPDEPGLNLLGQRDFQRLARELETLAQEARAADKNHGPG